MSERPSASDNSQPTERELTKELARLLGGEGARSNKAGISQDALALNNPAAERLANNGFGLLADGRGIPGGDRPNINKLGEVQQPPVDAAKNEGGRVPMTIDEQNRIIEIPDKNGITTKYDYKDDGSIEATQFKEEKQIGETKKYPNAKMDDVGTLTWHDGETSYLKRLDGFSQTRNVKDGRILESTDTSGITTKYNHTEDGTLEAKQIVDGKQVGETKKYPNGKIDEKGTISWDDGKTGHVVGLDGYREEKNLKDGSAKIYYPDGAWAEQRRDDKGIHTTTYADQVNNKKVAGRMEFFEPQTLKIDMPTGQREMPGVKIISNFYDGKTGRTIAQSLTFAPPGLGASVEAFGGELSYNFSSLDIFRSEAGKAEEAIFHADNVTLKDNKGIEKQVTAARVHETVDKDGTAMLGLSIHGFNPFVSTSLEGPNIPEKNAQIAAAGNDKDHDAEMNGLVGKLGSPKYADRMAAKDALTKMGRDALPFLRTGLNSTDAEVRNLSQLSINEIFASQASKPLPQSFVQKMHEIEGAVFSAQIAATDVKALSPEVRANFEKLIAQADNPAMAGIIKEELQARLALLEGAAEKRMEQELNNIDSLSNSWVNLPLSNSTNGAAGAADASEYMREKPQRQLETEERLLANAAHSSGRARAAYASVLSQTGNEADRKKAVELLTEVIKKDPGSVPIAKDDPDGESVIFSVRPQNDFLTAVNASQALADPEFVTTFRARIKNAESTLEMMRDL